MPDHPKVQIDSLNSWKEISLYMDRGVRTVQRWERELGLPVHRVGKGPRSPVHAFPSELSAWLLHADHFQNGRDGQPKNSLAKPRLHRDGASAVSRVLVQRSSSLVGTLVASMWTQRQRTEELVKSLEKVRSQLKRSSLPSRDGVKASEMQIAERKKRGPRKK